jgi:hypothetical protein
MSKQRVKPNYRRRVLRLPDLSVQGSTCPRNLMKIASATVNYPTSWASDASIVEQLRSVSPVAAELVEGQQKQVLHHAFCLNCEGEVNAAYPPEDREPSRWQVKVSEEAVTFIIDTPFQPII